MIPVVGPLPIVAAAVWFWCILPKHGRLNRWRNCLPPLLDAAVLHRFDAACDLNQLAGGDLGTGEGALSSEFHA
jgi:hypothetical protein